MVGTLMLPGGEPGAMRLVGLAVLALLLAGCTAPGPQPPTERADAPGNGTTPTDGPPSTPPPPLGKGDATNGTKPGSPGDGIVVTLTLDQANLTAGKVVTATAVAENRGRSAVTYQHGGCPSAQFLIRIEGTEEPFKPPIDFWNYTEEPRGCAAMIYTATLQPGERVVQQGHWNGHAGSNGERPHDGPAVPPGEYTVTATWLATDEHRAAATAVVRVA